MSAVLVSLREYPPVARPNKMKNPPDGEGFRVPGSQSRHQAMAGKRNATRLATDGVCRRSLQVRLIPCLTRYRISLCDVTILPTRP